MFEAIDHLTTPELDALIAESAASLQGFMTERKAQGKMGETTERLITQQMESINLMSLLRDLREDNKNE